MNRTNEAREQNDSVIVREEITTENPRDAQIEQASEQEESATPPEQEEEEATTRRSERTSRGKLPMRYKDFHALVNQRRLECICESNANVNQIRLHVNRMHL